LYLPGICIHAVPASRRQGSEDLHLEVEPFPAAFRFQPILSEELLDYEHEKVLATTSFPPPLPTRHPRRVTPLATSGTDELCTKCEQNITMLKIGDQAFENTSTSVAASQMRNALTALADTCNDPHQKEVSYSSACS
jgi:UTP--glucose-1-phosphate uridylyltransferase